MQRIAKYFHDVVAEMKMVTWSSRDEVVSATVLVVVFAVIMALVVWGIDEVLVKIVGLILQ
jgi:preprotein translocase subunit SecE